MGQYRAKDALSVPGLLSLARVPLGLLFVLVVGWPPIALGVLVVSAITDVLDGWYARKFNQATATGAALDPVTDKFFVGAVVVTLVLTARLSPLAIVLLSTREIGEIPLVLYLALSRKARRARAEQPRANVVGKVATALQFACVALAIVRAPLLDSLLWTTAAAGALAAVAYWARALKQPRTVTAYDRRHARRAPSCAPRRRVRRPAPARSGSGRQRSVLLVAIAAAVER